MPHKGIGFLDWGVLDAPHIEHPTVPPLEHPIGHPMDGLATLTGMLLPLRASISSCNSRALLSMNTLRTSEGHARLHTADKYLLMPCTRSSTNNRHK